VRFTPQFLRALHLELFTKPFFQLLFRRTSYLIHLKYNFVNDKYLKLIIFLSSSSSPVDKKFPFGFFKNGGIQEIAAQVLKFHRK
jgi:hypothetical protein